MPGQAATLKKSETDLQRLVLRQNSHFRVLQFCYTAMYGRNKKLKCELPVSKKTLLLKLNNQREVEPQRTQEIGQSI